MITNIFAFSTVQGKPYKSVELDANDVNKQYNNKFNDNSAMDRSQYNKKLVELLQQPVTYENDILAGNQEIFEEKNIAKAIPDPLRPLINTQLPSDEDMITILKHDN